MSELRVDKLSPQSGTEMTLGDSGDILKVPSGGFLKINNIDVLAVAPSTSGNVLTSNGSAWASSAAAGGATKEFYIPIIYNSRDTASPAYRGSNATNFEQTNALSSGYFVVANWYVPNDFTSVVDFKIMAAENGANNYDLDISTSFAAVGGSYSSGTDSLTVTGTYVAYKITEIDISDSLTGITANDWIGTKIGHGGSTGAHSFIGLRFKYS